MNSTEGIHRAVLISNNFQQALYSFDTPVNSQEARAPAF